MTAPASAEEDYHSLRESTSPLSDSRPRTPTPPLDFVLAPAPTSELNLENEEASEDAPIKDARGASASPQVSSADRPSKRRRVESTAQAPSTPVKSALRKKFESPPWKKAGAEGPTTILENGRRKSGRISTVKQQRSVAPSPPTPPAPLATKRHSRSESTPSIPSKHNHTQTTYSRRSSRSAQKVVEPTLSAKSAPRSSACQSQPSLGNSRRRSPSPTPVPSRQSTRSRNSRNSTSYTTPTTNDRPIRLSSRNLRNTVLIHTELPLIHPIQVPIRKRIATSLEEFFQTAGSVPTEAGGLASEEDGPFYSDELAAKDATSILRIESELENGGLLSAQRCSVFVPESTDEPPRQWAHYDHLAKAAQNFRRLMNAEQLRHKQTAKKLAEACREQWLKRQPKSSEQLEAEARVLSIARHRIVVRTMIGMWENVRAEVNRQRFAKWEAEEQKRVKAALNEAVNKSEAQLQARRNTLGGEGSDGEPDESVMDIDMVEDDLELMTDSAVSSGDEDTSLDSQASDLDDDDDDSNDGTDDEDMSSSDEDDDKHNGNDIGDEDLSPEQLRAKYNGVSAIAKDDSSRHNQVIINDDDASTSDESIDMDDDLGDTDMSETGSELGSGEEEDDYDSEGGDSHGLAHGLAGMLFSKEELRALKQEQTPDDTQSQTSQRPTIMAEEPETSSIASPMILDDDDEEVSLVPAPYTPTNEEDDPTSCILTTVAEERSAPQPNSIPVSPRTAAERSDSKGSTETPHDVISASIVNDQAMLLDAAGSDLPLSNGPEEEPMVEISTCGKSMAEPDDVIMTETTTHISATDDREIVVTSVEEISTETTSSQAMDLQSPLDTEALSVVDQIPKTEIPFLLRGNLREYQHYGLDWLAGLYANNTNGILADEMGLGKTIQTISLLAHLACHHGIWGPHLVVVPTSVMLNWEMEFKKWCPGFKIMAYYGTIEERRRKRHGWNNDDLWNVCITSYQLVLQDNQVFRRRKWHYLILDEAHNIKNFKSLRWQTLLGFNTQARLLITGTPLQNNLTELWSLLFFLMPSENGVGGFAGLEEFHDWFAKPESQILESGKEHLDDEGRAIIQKLHKVLRPYLLRRLKADVEKQMPAKYEHVEFCRLSKRQRELYDGFLARSDTRATLAGGNYLSIINCLMQLRKVCNHPDLFVDRPIQTSVRLDKSVTSEFVMQDKIVKRTILASDPMSHVSLNFLNLIPVEHENISSYHASRIMDLGLPNELLESRDAQKERTKLVSPTLDPTTVESSIKFVEGTARFSRFEELQHCVYLNTMRRQRQPMYGKDLTTFLTLDLDKRPRAQRPRVPAKVMEWFENESFLLRTAVKDINQRSSEMETTITKFACVTPAVVTRDPPDIILGTRGVAAFQEEDLRLSTPVRWSPFISPEPPVDPWHEARIRLSIQFPDKRLLQYDCGKLQTLDRLLRKLQADGHRALIFTQMTRVLDILEQFLNIHGHKYLRLDGATKVEQRQLLTDRFNSDNRILCFILSTRSGGLGINLTGADTVIFYDQDWNPAMDKQCQDRCHRIGQTRDVHIYRLVSEHTIEANILRKASQKQMLDDVVIQDGGFTTDYFARKNREAVDEDDPELDLEEGIAAASAAMDRVLGGGGTGQMGHQLEQVEDREDVTAARAAEKEIQTDEADFSERDRTSRDDESSVRPSEAPSEGLTPRADGSATPGFQVIDETEFNAWGKPIRNIDEYMISEMSWFLQGVPLEIPKDKKKAKARKKGKDGRRR